MRRLRKSIHNFASALASSFSPNSGQYLAGFAQENGFRTDFRSFSFWHFVSFLRSCSICLFTTWLLIPRQREKTDTSLSAKQRISKQMNPRTHTTNRLMFCFVQLLFYFSVFVVHGVLQVCIGLCGVAFWNCGVIPHWGFAGWLYPIFPVDWHIPLVLIVLNFSAAFVASNPIMLIWESSQNWIFQGCCRYADALNWMLHFADVQPSLRDDVTDICPAYLQHCITGVRGTIFWGPFLSELNLKIWSKMSH